jgi:hypothetical protein
VKSDNNSSLLEEATRQLNDGKFSRAFTLLKDLLAADPSHHEARRLLATLLLKFGNLVTAKHAFEALLQEAFQRGDYALAESLLKEYLAVGARCVPFIEMLGEVYERKKDPIAAAIEYEKAIRITLEDPDPENSSHARELYEKIKRIAPDSFVLDRLTRKFEVLIPGPPSEVSTRKSTEPAPEPIQTTQVVPIDDTTCRIQVGSVEAPEPRESTACQDTDSGSTTVPHGESRDMPSSSIITEESGSSPEPSDGPPFPALQETPNLSMPPELLSQDDKLGSAGSTVDECVDPRAAVHASVSSPPSHVSPSIDKEIPEPGPMTSETSHEDEDGEEERVPFPLVNQIACSSPPIEEDTQELSMEGTDSDALSDTGRHEAPFWERVEEAKVTPELAGEGRETAIHPEVGEDGDVEPAKATVSSQTDHSLESWPQPVLELQPMAPPAVMKPPVLESAEEQMALQASPAPGLAAQTPRSPEEDTDKALRVATIRSPELRRRIKTSRSDASFLALLRAGIATLSRGCVRTVGSVVRLIIFLGSGLMALSLLGVGLAAAVWFSLDQKPTGVYQDLAKISTPRTIEDPATNGYFLLLGFDAGFSVNPVQAGYERWLSGAKELDPSCAQLSSQRDQKEGLGVYQAADLAQPSKPTAGRGRALTTSEAASVIRYRQWLNMPFDDWGFGYLGSPDCAQIIAVHRLYVAEGFSQDISKGLERLETDLTAWRSVLEKAKTLSMKNLSVQAINDNIAVMSELLSRRTLDNKWAQRFLRLARPLERDERAMRWPMQNEFLLELKRMDGRLHANPDVDSWMTLTLLNMPLPKQRTLNGYAGYYDALIRTPDTKEAALPEEYEFARTPVRTWIDYVINPVDNLVREHAESDWKSYLAEIHEVDARLRLVGLQARLRGPLSESNLSARIAQAGPNFYDPFTELPMLLNMAQGRLYSVGRDGKDDGGDPTFDISVSLPVKGS